MSSSILSISPLGSPLDTGRSRIRDFFAWHASSQKTVSKKKKRIMCGIARQVYFGTIVSQVLYKFYIHNLHPLSIQKIIWFIWNRQHDCCQCHLGADLQGTLICSGFLEGQNSSYATKHQVRQYLQFLLNKNFFKYKMYIQFMSMPAYYSQASKETYALGCSFLFYIKSLLF